MKLLNIIQRVNWADVSKVLTEHYSFTDELIEQYEDVFSTVSNLTPVDTKFKLKLTYHTDSYDGLPYLHVNATDGTLNKELDDYSEWKANSTTEFDNEEVSFSLGFTPWAEWAGIHVDPATVAEFSDAEFSDAEVVAHCLWEMTFYGLTEEDTTKQLDIINSRMADFDAMTDEELDATTTSWDELRASLNLPEQPDVK